jgi:hypothetical protein
MSCRTGFNTGISEQAEQNILNWMGDIYGIWNLQHPNAKPA